MRIKVLLVDSHEVVLDGLKAILKQDPLFESVGEAGSGKECLEKIEGTNPEIILIGLDLPQNESVVMTRRIHRGYPDVKIVILSMYAEKEIVTEALISGASGYILKCEPSENILFAIKQVSEGQKYVSPSLHEYLVEFILNPEKNSDKKGIGLLSDRELEIIQLIAESYSAKDIGNKLHISRRTVETHRSNIMKKLGLHSIVELVKFAIQVGIVHI